MAGRYKESVLSLGFLAMKSYFALFLWINMIIAFWAATSCEDLSASKCADLQLVHGGFTVTSMEVKEGSYVNITFELTTQKCQYKPDWFRVRVATSQKGLRFTICTIVFRGYTCNVTESSPTCQCLGKGQMYASMYKKVSKYETAFVLDWTDATKLPEQEEKTILIHFPEAEEGGSRTSVILGVCLTVLLAILVIAAIIIYLRKSRDMKHQSRGKNSFHTYTNTQETPQSRRQARSMAAASNRASLHIGVPQNTRTTLSSQVPTDSQVTFITQTTPNSQVPEESQEIPDNVINVHIPVRLSRYDHIFL